MQRSSGLNLLCRFLHFSFVLRKNEKEQTNDSIYSIAPNLYCKLLQKGSLYINTHYYMALYNVQFLQCAENNGFTGEKDCIGSFLCSVVMNGIAQNALQAYITSG